MKRVILPITIWGVLLSTSLSVCAQSGPDDIIAKLKAFEHAHLTEKAYLHFDKPYYAAGDTIYFKAYVTMGERHVPSTISVVLHVDLINTANKVDQRIMLQLNNGVGWGDLALPDSLPAGNYRIHAYTRWMRNDESSFFEQAIPVGSLQKNKIPESGTAHQQANVRPDVQFFPESGDLVMGVRSRIAFKAIGGNGLGIDVRGSIQDNENTEVAAFTSARLGMGSFYLTPEPGKTYKAKILFANGTTDMIQLPKPEDRGIVLSINNDSIPNAAVRIEASKDFYRENKDKKYDLLIYSGAVATTVSFKLDSAVILMDIIKRKLFTGVAMVTLFSPENEPLCERVLFVQNYGQLKLDVSTNSTSYKPREKVRIKLNAKTRADSAAAGHFSVSVIDESKVPVDENNERTILTNLLLTSDLKGYVEQPNYYFTDSTGGRLKDLDLVMLTNGYRRFEWKQVLNNTYPPAAYQPERTLVISGKAKNLSGKPLPKAVVALIAVEKREYRSDTTDSNGHFSFANLTFADTTRFVLQAVNAKGKNNTQLTYESETPPSIIPVTTVSQASNTNTSMTAYLDNSEKQQEELNKYGQGKGKTLNEVKIKAIRENNNYPSSSLMGPGHADQVMHSDELEKIQGLLTTSLNGRLIGVRFIPNRNGFGFTPVLSSPPSGPMLVVVDGVYGGDINTLVASQVETVEVLRFASAAIYGMQGGNGVLIITTKHGQGLQDIPSIGILPITARGFHKAREFYSPKYEYPEVNGAHKDLRSTIYWQPELATDKEGNAAFEFYNADGRGNYRVVVEGIDENGNMGRRVYRYKVE